VVASVLLHLIDPSPALADGPLLPPAEPASHVDASVALHGLQAGDAGGIAAGLDVAAEWAPWPALSLGAGVGLRLTHLRDRQTGAAAGRFGAAPFGLSIGTGFRRGGLGLGLRVVGAVGAEALDGGGPRGAVGLRLDAGLSDPRCEIRIGADVATVFDRVAMLAGGVAVRLVGLGADRPVRPLAGVSYRFAPDLRPAFRIDAGAVLRVAPTARLRVVVVAGLPEDPEGLVAGIEIGVLWAPGTGAAMSAM
jgi:hypothetical protein